MPSPLSPSLFEKLEPRALLSGAVVASSMPRVAPVPVWGALAIAPTPQAPTLSYTKVGTTGLKLTWPSPTGGTAVAKYRVTYTPGSAAAGKTIELASSARSVTLSNLAAFTLYSINVSAIDAAGKSATTHLNAWTAAPSTQKRYLYVFDLPKDKQGFTNLRPQIEVFDVNNGHKWVKNIPLPTGIYAMRGLAASTSTGKAYFTFYNTPKDTYQTGGLVCIDMVSNKIVWIRRYTKEQVPSPDRFDITPDGKTIYMPVGENGPDNFWRIIDAATGNPLGKINFVTAPHNTIVSLDGKRVFLEGQEKGTQPAEWNHRIGVVDTATNKLVKTIGPFRDVVRPFTINGKGTLVFATVNNFVGFQVADVNTGKIKYTVAPPGYAQPNPPLGRALSHGIAITPDEKTLWVVDGLKIGVHVWDISKIATQAPTYLGFVKTRATGKNLAGQKDSAASNDAAGVPAWLAVSYDGRYIYPESGEIIDTATRKEIGQLRPKTTNSLGQLVDAPYTHGRFMIEVDFDNGKVVHTTDQFGVGLVR